MQAKKGFYLPAREELKQWQLEKFLPNTPPENRFEYSVAMAIRKLGWSVNCQHGHGEFRIDIVIKSKKEPERFLLAIECDGHTYHSRPEDVEYDKWRQKILESQGWIVRRIAYRKWWPESRTIMHQTRLCLDFLEATDGHKTIDQLRKDISNFDEIPAPAYRKPDLSKLFPPLGKR